jgi:6-oxo-cyclohex-1-ene-carbonyl-CoA hydrolase
MMNGDRALESGTLCEVWSAHKVYLNGMITSVVPALKVADEWVANPMVETQQMFDAWGRFAFGESKSGEALADGKALIKQGQIDLSLLDQEVESLCAKLLLTFPDCMTKTLEELRKPKLEAWNRNKEDSRAWLANNMMTEARAGFRAFNEGTKTCREVDFVALRQALAKGEPWTDDFTDSLMPANQ